MRTQILLAFITILICGAFGFANMSDKANSARAKMPIKEITVFKDGHVFVVQQGQMPTDNTGNVLMDNLPSPILGTFWPFSSDKSAKLAGVVASQQRVSVERTALDISALLAANTGAEVIITEKVNTGNSEIKYDATIIGIPTRSTEELDTTDPADAGGYLPIKSNLILLKTSNGVKVVSIDQIRDVTFKQAPKTSLINEEFRNNLVLKLDWGKSKPTSTADVGLIYVQKGIRWIPSYQITLDGNGNAVIKLQATLLNELDDLNNVTANLVIGVPTFAFKDTLDPISLGKTASQLSQYFQGDQRNNMLRSNNISIDGLDNNLTNSITTQTARMNENVGSNRTSSDLGPEIPASGQNEDLFIFTVKNITLPRGNRLVITVAEQTVKYQDVYTLDLPFSPPLDLRQNFNTQQQVELARLLNAPKFIHKIRINNSTIYPFTTAPALIVRDDRVLAQGLMTFTSIGASTDLEITKAVNIAIHKTDNELKRTPNAVKWQDNDYGRVDLASTIKLNNFSSQPAYLEITRQVLGNISTASENGIIETTNILEDNSYLNNSSYAPFYNWPSWWAQVNGLGRITWKINLAAGKSATLDYTWHYFWR